MGLDRLQRSSETQVRCSYPGASTLSEVFAERAGDASVVQFALARLAQSSAPVLWVQDRLSRKETGRPYLPGLGAARPVIMVSLSRAADVLWAMEDGLRCKTLGAVIGEIWGDPSVLGFTATKRLALRSEASQVPCWLIRRAATPNLSAARDRWRVVSLPAVSHPHDPQAPGLPRWSVDLFRSRTAKPGQWVATYDWAADRLDLAASVRDGALAAGNGTARQRTAG